MVIDATGFATVMWTETDGAGHYSYVVTRPAGGPWSTPKDLEPGSYGENVVVDLAADGTVTAAWQNPAAGVRVARHPQGSAVWTTPDTVGSGYSPTLATGPGGHQAVAWSDIASGRVRARVITSRGDWAAASSEDVSPAGATAYQPRIAFGPGDVLEAAWSQHVTSVPYTEELHGASRSAAGAWTSYGAALSVPDYTTRPDAIGVDSSGDVTVVWDALHANFTSHLRSRTRHAGTWEAEAATISDKADTSSARLVVDGDDNFTVVYSGEPAATSSRTATTAWAAPTPLSGTGSVVGIAAQLAGSGRALVAWVRDYRDDTFHSVVETTSFAPAAPTDDVPPTTVLNPLPTYVMTGRAPVAWTATDSQSRVEGVDLRARWASWNGGFGGYATLLSGTSATSASIAIAAGRTQCFSARATDIAANVGGWSTERCTVTPADDRIARRSKGWARASGSGYYRGSALIAKHRGSTLTVPGVHARRIALVVSTGPRNGKVAVFWRGTRLGVWSLAASTGSHQRLIAIRTWPGVRTGTLVVKVVSARKPVRVDGFALGQR